jgi:hypothetical protein
MEQSPLSALLRKSRSAAKAVALPSIIAIGAAAASLFAPQAANALTVQAHECTLPLAAGGFPACGTWQHGDKLVTFDGFDFAIAPPAITNVKVDYQWFDFDSNSNGAPFNYGEDLWQITVSSLTPNQPFVGPFDLSYSYTIDIIDGPGLDSNGVAFDGTKWYFNEFGVGQDAIGDRTTTFKTVDPDTGAPLDLVCDTTNTGTVCDGLTPLLALNKSVQITDRIVVTETNSLVTAVSNSWNQKTKVPGPLPILGAGVAFGYSRKLKRRITKAAVA